MGLFSKIKKLFSKKEKIEEIKIEEKQEKEEKIVKKEKVITPTPKTAHILGQKEEEPEEMFFEDVWSYISPSNNTQAHHLISVIGFDEWVDMDEIKRRIKEMFFIEYKNIKSLYPYVKTLTDVGLLETNSAGGRRKWRKKEFIIKIRNKELEENLIKLKY
jgi:hypothetical protein